MEESGWIFIKEPMITTMKREIIYINKKIYYNNIFVKFVEKNENEAILFVYINSKIKDTLKIKIQEEHYILIENMTSIFTKKIRYCEFSKWIYNYIMMEHKNEEETPHFCI